MCNNDPRVLYDSANGRWIVTSFSGSTFSESTTAQEGIYIAVSATADPTGAWHKYVIPLACSAIAGSPYVDFPRLGQSANWIVAEPDCASKAGSAGEVIWAIDKAALYSGTMKDYRFVDQYRFDAPLQSVNGDSTLYFANVTSQDGSYVVNFSKLSGPSGSVPALTQNFNAPIVVFEANTKSGGPLEVVPDLDQVNCTHCLGHASNFVEPLGDEDTWANGDSVLEVVFNQKYGGTTHAGTADGGAVYEVATYDLKTGSSPFTFISGDSTKGGGIAHGWPSIAHHVVGEHDYVFLTDTLATTIQHPTAEYVMLTPLLNTVGSYISSYDDTNNGVIGNRWGDYSTSVFDAGSGLFWGFNDYNGCNKPTSCQYFSAASVTVP